MLSSSFRSVEMWTNLGGGGRYVALQHRVNGSVDLTPTYSISSDFRWMEGRDGFLMSSSSRGSCPIFKAK